MWNPLSVMGTAGRLQRVFPGPTEALDGSTFDQPNFQSAIAQTLSRMSKQSVGGTKAKVRKAGQMHDEDREATHPKMVTEFIMAIVRPRCTTVEALQIQKSTREEALWNHCRSPWRRSALWLLSRVVLQLVLRRLTGNHDLYKSFMIFFMASLVKILSAKTTCENVYVMTSKVTRRLLKLDLPEQPSSQHEGLYEEMKALLDQNSRRRMFFPGDERDEISLPRLEETLLGRAKIRTSSFRVSRYGADDKTHEYDSHYHGLDRERATSQGSRVFALCKMIYDDISCVRKLSSNLQLTNIWSFLSQSPEVHGDDFQIDVRNIRYDARLVLEADCE